MIAPFFFTIFTNQGSTKTSCNYFEAFSILCLSYCVVHKNENLYVIYFLALGISWTRIVMQYLAVAENTRYYISAKEGKYP